MSRKYKCPADVPNDVLAKRLNELALAVAGGKESLLREFDMRIPVELDRDADLVLSLSSTRLQSLTQRTEVLTEALEKARQHLLAKYGECPIWINQVLASKALPPPEGE